MATLYLLAARHERQFLPGPLAADYRRYASDGDDPNLAFGEYRRLYPMERFGAAYPRQLCILPKLMLAPGYRSGTLLSLVASALYAHTRMSRRGAIRIRRDLGPLT